MQAKKHTMEKWRTQQGFTLLELLIVIAIIAILAAILLPTIQTIFVNVEKKRATTEARQIQQAIETFYTDYNRLPIDRSMQSGNSGDQSFFDGTAKPIFLALIGEDTKINPRKTVYLSNAGINTSTGDFFDPWGNSYDVKLDRDHDNQVKWGTDYYKVKSIVRSKGPDGTTDTSDDIITTD